MLKKRLKDALYFYAQLRMKLVISLVIGLVGTVLEGFGLAMFLPLLGLTEGRGEINAEELGSLKFVVDGLENANIPLNLQNVLLVIILFFLLKGAFKYIQGVYDVKVREDFIRDIRLKGLSRLNEISFTSFINLDTGRIQNTLSNEITKLAQAFRSYLITVHGVIIVVVYVTLAAVMNPKFVLLVVLSAALSNWLYRFINKLTRDESEKLPGLSDTYHRLLTQYLYHYKYLKATASVHKYSQKLNSYISDMASGNKKIGVFGAIIAATKEPLVILFISLAIAVEVLYFGSKISTIFLSLLFFYRSLTYLTGVQSNWNSFIAQAGALEAVQTLIKQLGDHKDMESGQLEMELSDKVQFNSLSFAYTHGERVLKDVSIEIPALQTIALVGASGSGKTTIANMVAGLFPAASSGLQVDGHDFQKMNRQSWQSRLGYITQEPVIFSDTIFNNVTFWDDQTPENTDQFWRCLKMAAIDDFVQNLPDKADAMLGANGINLSGGQKQRISIARELYKDVNILILDEATSALDSESEHAIQKNIDSLQGQVTMILIAHRLSTIKKADKVVLLSHGEVVNTGTFDWLVQNEPSFSRMVELQAL